MQITNSWPGGACTESHEDKIEIVAGEDGNASGTVSIVKASNNSCHGYPYYGKVGWNWPITAVVNDAGFTFPVNQFMGSQGQGSAFIPKAGNQASGTAKPSYSPDNGYSTHTYVMTFDLKCKSCAP